MGHKPNGPATGMRRAAAAACLCVPLLLGGCGLTSKSYTLFDNYNASQQAAANTHLRDGEAQTQTATALASDGQTVASSAANTLAAHPGGDLSAVRDQLAQQAQDASRASIFTPLALSEVRDQTNNAASALVRQVRPCDPFAGVDVAGAAPGADACAPPKP